MKSRILVFPCGSEVGLEIHNALRFSTHIELFGGSSVESNHGKYIYQNYLEGFPHIDDDSFIDYLNHIVEQFNICLIYPAHDSVVLKLAENLHRIKCKVIGSPLNTCYICRSKKKTYETLQGKIAIPKVYQYSEKYVCDYPVFLKPDIGQGSKGTYKVDSVDELEFYLRKDKSLLILEYLPGKEYTIDCFTDKDGHLLFIGPRERIRMSNGISADTKAVERERFQGLAEVINRTLEFRGAWFFQVKERSDKELALLEIAPRIAGTMGFTRNIGVNLSLLSVFDALEIAVEINVNNYYLRMDRALVNRFKLQLEYQNVYIDFDDTILLNHQINIEIIAFLYQCINRNIKIHLLSKHNELIEDTLKRYRIKDIFDTVTVLEMHEEKADYIFSKSAIFIDDSYAERKRVQDKCDIPTFDLSAVESLMDWRM